MCKGALLSSGRDQSWTCLLPQAGWSFAVTLVSEDSTAFISLPTSETSVFLLFLPILHPLVPISHQIQVGLPHFYLFISCHLCMPTKSPLLLNDSGFPADDLAVPFSDSFQHTVNDHSKDQVRSHQDPSYSTYWLLSVLEIKFQMYIHWILWDLFVISTLSPQSIPPTPGHALLVGVPYQVPFLLCSCCFCLILLLFSSPFSLANHLLLQKSA